MRRFGTGDGTVVVGPMPWIRHPEVAITAPVAILSELSRPFWYRRVDSRFLVAMMAAGIISSWETGRPGGASSVAQQVFLKRTFGLDGYDVRLLTREVIGHLK